MNHSFKGSRIQTFTDQINYLLLTSDPKISDLIIKGINKKKEIKLIPLDVLTLIDQSKCEKYGIPEKKFLGHFPPNFMLIFFVSRI